MNPYLVTLAYKYVAIAAMLVEINYCSGKLQLHEPYPVAERSLKLAHVSNPYATGFGGTLETDNYSFVFFKSGTLRRIQRINLFEKIPLRELQLKQARMKSLVDTNGAYQLATNWLSAISVDVAALEKKFPCSVEQRFFYPDATSLDDPPEKKARVVLLPVFHVIWGDKEQPAVMISIFGPTKEMLGIYQNDDSFSKRPKELLKDPKALLEISDDEFTKYSNDQKTDLVARFLAANDVATNAGHYFQKRDPKGGAK